MSKTEIKEIRPKDIDVKYYGEEPKFDEQTLVSRYQWHLASSFSWYNRFCDRTSAKEFICDYLNLRNRNVEAKIVRSVSDSNFMTTYGWLARVSCRGLALSAEHISKLDDEIERLKSLSIKNKSESKEEVESPHKHNVYELMRERTLEVGGNLEGLWDDYLQDGAKKTPTFPVVDLLTKSNILPHHVPILISAWQSKLDEYYLVQSGKDESLNEAYERFTKTQIKNIVGTIEQIISDLNSYISVKKAGRKPRAKKPISVDKLVRKLKYQKTFKDDALGLNLVSLSSTKLHGCSEAWVYDTKKRKLYHFIADEYSKSIGVKGNAVIGFCTKQSEAKTLRKPADQIKEIMGSKPAARKFFKEIKAVSTTPNGKFNPNMIILKAF